MIDQNHLLINAKINNPTKDKEEAARFLNSFVLDLGMKSITDPFVSYIETSGTRGIFGNIVVESGYIAFHMLDEQTPASMQLDIYVYDQLKLSSLMSDLGKYFELIYMDYALLNREKDIRIRAQGRITNKKD